MRDVEARDLSIDLLGQRRPTPFLLAPLGVMELVHADADKAVARAAAGARVLVETDTVTAGSAWQIFTELKTARAGIVLQLEESDGAGIFRVQFLRATRADFPQGRGFFIDAGKVRRLQVALPPDVPAL